MKTFRKYRGRILFCSLFWAVIPLFLLINCVMYPTYWVLKYGIDDTPYTILAYNGWIITWQEISDIWKLEE